MPFCAAVTQEKHKPKQVQDWGWKTYRRVASSLCFFCNKLNKFHYEFIPHSKTIPTFSFGFPFGYYFLVEFCPVCPVWLPVAHVASPTPPKPRFRQTFLTTAGLAHTPIPSPEPGWRRTGIGRVSFDLQFYNPKTKQCPAQGAPAPATTGTDGSLLQGSGRERERRVPRIRWQCIAVCCCQLSSV